MWPHIAAFVLAAISVMMFWDEHPSVVTLGWLVATALLYILRWLLMRYFMLVSPGVDTIRNWGWFYAAGACASGLIWGAFPWLMLNASSEFNVLYILMMLSGFIVGALGIQSRFLPAYFAFVIPIEVLTCARLMVEERDLQAIVVLLIIFSIAMFFYARDYHQLMRKTIRRQFENTDLIRQLEQKSKAVEKASQDKTRFLAAASHDLRQPHQAVGLFVESLSCIEKDPDKRAILDKTRAAYRSMSALLDQLLDISKLDSGVEKPSMRSIRLQTLLQSIYLEHAPVAEQKGLSFRLRPTQAIVTTDPAMLKRMLGNLLSNAIAYTSTGGVLIGVRRHGGLWRVHVWDTGCGIAADQIENVFDEFTQLHNSERDSKKGLGLGLAIVKRMEGLIHAPVSVYSRPDKGSLFTVDLMPGLASEVEMDAFRPQQGISLSGTVLVVIDDDFGVRDSITVLLKTWGCSQVFSFASGEEALASMRVANIRPDAIISDYRLRDHHTGVEAIAALQALFSADIPALLITGDTAPDRIEEAAKSGFPLLHKPIDPDDLKRFLASLSRQTNNTCKQAL
ncbi:MAG: hybrid sensor histidine kinase/response regulator [Mariprofundus sp.]|nr:hybrid sensor histidine kinase/response regulator [Mariprofundus sp.]